MPTSRITLKGYNQTLPIDPKRWGLEGVAYMGEVIVESIYQALLIDNVYVHPLLRNKGLGTELVKQLEEVSVKNFKGNWFWLTSTSGGYFMYRKLGYMPIKFWSVDSNTLSVPVFMSFDEVRQNDIQARNVLNNLGGSFERSLAKAVIYDTIR